MRRLVLASSLGAGLAASLVSRPVLCRDAPAGTLTLEAIAARVSALEAVARLPHVKATAAPATIIDGKAIAANIRSEVRQQSTELAEKHGVVPGLAVVLVGNRTDSKTYVRMKKRAADECGFYSVDKKFDETVTQQQLIDTVHELNNDPKVHRPR